MTGDVNQPIEALPLVRRSPSWGTQNCKQWFRKPVLAINTGKSATTLANNNNTDNTRGRSLPSRLVVAGLDIKKIRSIWSWLRYDHREKFLGHRMAEIGILEIPAISGQQDSTRHAYGMLAHKWAYSSKLKGRVT